MVTINRFNQFLNRMVSVFTVIITLLSIWVIILENHPILATVGISINVSFLAGILAIGFWGMEESRIRILGINPRESGEEKE